LNHDDDPLLPSADNKYRKVPWYLDIAPYFMEWMVVAVLLLTWFIVTFTLHVPGCGAGYLGPGGLADNGLYRNCTGGAAGYIDKLVFGENHIYDSPTCQAAYLTGSYDPEGLLGYLTSIVICYLGVQVGRIIIVWKSPVARMKRWFFWGLLWGALGTILCFGQQNGGPVPINKNLWSASFILVMAGSGNIVLTIYYFLVDVTNVWNGAPFIYVGMNPILIYCGHEILNPYFPFSYNIVDPTHMSLMLSNLIGVSVW
jgi:heparan-alpha-glucosaminide N-acetyltransferase